MNSQDFDFTSYSDLETESGEFEFTPFEPKEHTEQKEGKLKSFFRSLYQLPSGALQAITYPLDILQMMAMGDALDPEEIDNIRMASQRMGVPFDEDKYREAVQQAASIFPTQSNLERYIEERTGAPLQPKTKIQKGLKLASTAGKITPGTITQKGVAAATAPAVSTGLEELGVPESIAELVGLGTGTGAGSIGPKTAPKVTTKTKLSGLPVRRYEKVTEPRQISQKKAAKISEKLESDFRKISDQIVKESPIAETIKSIEENPGFKQEVADQFRKVEELAESMPGVLPTKEIKKRLIEGVGEQRKKGITATEYEKDLNKYTSDLLKEIPEKNIKVDDLVSQYRKNNKQLSEIYDPSKSYASNRAKKEAILEYNRAIASTIEDLFPNTEFSKLFKETNATWTKISDAEAISKFIDGMFDGKVDYGKGKKFFLNENQARPFKRALGEENFKKFDQLMKDMLSTEKAAKMLKVAQKEGFKDLANTATTFILHPKLGKARFAYNQSKKLYKGLMNALLDKPELMITWESGVQNLKKGNFSEADKKFKTMQKFLARIKKED